MLRFIYVFFVGLFIAVFVGTGIAVFYPAPKAPEPPASLSAPQKSPSDTAVTQELAYSQRQRAYQDQMAVYNRNVSILAMVIAVALLVVALVFVAQIGVVANGLLLGGIFTLLYGIGRGMASADNKYRFLVAAVGLAVTLVLGYLKFGSRPAAHKP